MRKKLLTFCIILIITIIALNTTVHANKTDTIFYNSTEYNKIINNKEHIKEVYKESYPEGGYEGSTYSIDKAYDMVKSLKNIKKSNINICDADSRYIFKFDDGTSVIINFEGDLLHYKGQNYEIIKNK